MLAIPIIVALALLLAWALIRLTLDALPVFAAIAVGNLAQCLGCGPVLCLTGGVLAGIALAAVGRAGSGGPATFRVGLGLAFAIPAGAAAFYTVRGLSGLVDGGRSGTAVTIGVAVLIGMAAWQRTVASSRRA